MDKLPVEVLVGIFGYLSLSDLLSSSQVCRFWHQVSLFPELWKNLSLNQWKYWKEEPGEDIEWIDVFKNRYYLDNTVPSCLYAMILPETRAEALHFFFVHAENVYESLSRYIEKLWKEQPENMNQEDVPSKNISILYYAEPIKQWIYTKTYAMCFRELMKKEEVIEEDGAILLSCWATKKSKFDITRRLDEYALHFRNYIELNMNCTIEQLFEDDRHGEVVKLLLKYFHDILKFSGNMIDYYNSENSFLHTVIENGTGIPITLCIIFQSIARRVGLNVRSLNTPSHFLLCYVSPSTVSNYQIIDVFDKSIITIDEVNRLIKTNYSFQTLPFAEPADVWLRQLNNLSEIYKRTSKKYLVDITSFQLEIEDNVQYYARRIIINKSRGYTELAKEDLRILKQKQEYTEYTRRLEIHIQEDLDDELPKDIRKRSDIQHEKVKYKVGHVFHHIRYGYRGVIYSWDSTCKSDPQWISQMGVNTLPRGANQPFYNVLVDKRDRHAACTYVAEENIGNICEDLIENTEVGKFFNEYSYETHRYIPNDYLASLYPEDN